MTFLLRPKWKGPILLAGIMGLFASNTSLANQAVEQARTLHPIWVVETLAIRRVSEPEISPDGTRVAYVVTQPIKEANRDHAVLYVADTAHAGSALTLAEGFHITTVRWSSDAKRIFFVREDESGRNIWEAPSSGGPARRLTDIQGELVHVAEFSLPVDPYEVSTDGTVLFYAVYDTAAAHREFERKTLGGRLYEGEGYWRGGGRPASSCPPSHPSFQPTASPTA